MRLGDVLAMVGRSLRNPREGAAEVLAYGVPKDSQWILIAAAVVISVLVSKLAEVAYLAIGRTDVPMPGLTISVLMVGGSLLLLIGLVQTLGRMFGGTAAPTETVVLMCWFQFISAFLAVAQLIFSLIAVPLGQMAAIGLFVVQIILLTQFVTVLHGFTSTLKVFGAIMVTAFLVGFVLLLVMGTMGIAPPLQSIEAS